MMITSSKRFDAENQAGSGVWLHAEMHEHGAHVWLIFAGKDPKDRLVRAHGGMTGPSGRPERNAEAGVFRPQKRPEWRLIDREIRRSNARMGYLIDGLYP